jgi:RimJ/RimL family protein N-acetyltransferase
MDVRTIHSGDYEHYRSILARTTEEDRYCRFFHLVDHFDPHEVRRFVEPQTDRIGLIAVEGKSALGAAHAFFLPESTAELAIVVAGDARRRGVGTALFSRLITGLRHRGYRHVIAYALEENHALGALARRVGMHSEGLESGVIAWAIEDEAA